jgi:hypothetical protein
VEHERRKREKAERDAKLLCEREERARRAAQRVPLRFIEKCREHGISLGGAEQIWEAGPSWTPRRYLLPPKNDAERDERERYAALEADMARIAAEWQQVPATAGA